MKDYLKWGALVAALVGTASAEYSLAVACGFDTWFAWCVPAALDLYVVRALQVKRDVLAVVLAMIVVNVLSHLVSSSLLEVSVPVVVIVSSIAPLVLWRVHDLGDGLEVPGDVSPAVSPELETELEAPGEELETAGDEAGEGELTLVDQLLMLGEPLPGRSRVMEMYGVTAHQARVALQEVRQRLEKVSS